MDTIEKLDRLHELQTTVDVVIGFYSNQKEEVLTPEQNTKLTEIDAEMNAKLAELDKQINEMAMEIKLDVLRVGKTVPGKFLMAVYNKGRITWDNKGLEGFMVAHPEIVAFRKEGDPSVTLRKISNKGEN